MTDDEIRAVITAMTRDRGFIINSFAQIECLLADLIEQCRRFEEYEEIARVIPFSANNRVTAVRELVKAGPLAPFAAKINSMLRRFMEFEELRHLFTHGFASFRPRKEKMPL